MKNQNAKTSAELQKEIDDLKYILDAVYNGSKLRKCQNCGKYFISKTKAIYCESCRKTSEYDKLYRQTDIIKTNRSILTSLRNFPEEKEKYITQRNINKKKMTNENYLKWLEKYKNKTHSLVIKSKRLKKDDNK